EGDGVRPSEELVFCILRGGGRRPGVWPSLTREARTGGVRMQSCTAQGMLRRARLGEGLPDVVYNRVATRSQERSAEVCAVKAMLCQRRIPFFNARFFDKREVLSTLQEDEHTAGLLPTTVVDPDLESVRSLLETGDAVYLKPYAGSYGEGICRIERAGAGYRVSHRIGQATVVDSFSTLRACLAAARGRMNRAAHVAQQAVPLRTYEGAPTDFRIHVQRAEGDWEVVAIGAKVARPGGVTTHVKAGGRVEAGDVVLESWFGADAPRMRERLEDAATRIAARLSSALDPGLAELGIDLGIAEDGSLGVFEANAKPGRAIFLHPRLRTASAASCRLLIARALSLRRFPGSDRVGAKTAAKHAGVVS
ncbi:MAG: YheC/YheD family protein, partial [Firmicutes bacterium]|nr:YheC/YheD family protein [Bacillota bacterium]